MAKESKGNKNKGFVSHSETMRVSPKDHGCATLRGGTAEGRAWQVTRYGGTLCQPVNAQTHDYACTFCGAGVSGALPIKAEVAS